MANKKRGWLLLLLCLFCLAGCSQKKLSADPAAGRYAVYYLDKTATKLTPLIYETQTTDRNQLVGELMQQFLHVPSAEDLITATGDKTRYESFSFDEKVLYVYFDENYQDLKTERKTLCAAALTATLSQIDGVEHVGIYSGGKPLAGVDGSLLGPFSANDFVNSVSDVNSYETVDLQLYFAAADGKKFTEETRGVTYRADTLLEQVAVEQLIAGPRGSGKAVLPSDTKLLSISVNENICYLNFSREFLNPVTDVSPDVSLYALVDTLTGLRTVQRVRIAVEGSQNVLFRDSISLDALFEQNLDYIGKEFSK